VPGTALSTAQSWEPGQFSINGQRPNANYFMVDGAGANVGVALGTFLEQTGAGTAPSVSALGGTNSLVPVDALQNFAFETSSYAPNSGVLWTGFNHHAPAPTSFTQFASDI
jgi:hypothetical protein